jgi:signal transduction histidine kinase
VRRRLLLPPGLAHAARVALAASLLVCVVYAGCAAVLNAVISTRLIGEVDARLQERVADIREVGLKPSADDDDIDSAPVYLWRAAAAGPVAQSRSAGPVLPASLKLSQGKAVTIRLPRGEFRLYYGGPYIAGQSLGDQQHLLSVLRDGEALAAPVLLLAMFAGALTIGLRALSPVEQSRRRQLEFTADASHELRTPLSVISAETSIALSAPRDAAAYQEALTRIGGESRRLQRIVEDMLWLARFDSAPPQPGYEPLDLETIAADCAQRFAVLAKTRDLDVVGPESASTGPASTGPASTGQASAGPAATGAGAEPAWISAPAEWVDRLAGVLADNACRYAGTGGVVRIGVSSRGNRVCLTVEDSGPGIAPEHLSRLFDRFHRSTEQGGSAGLGLAIADSIVRSTGGQWFVGSSDLGGAKFEVSWRRAGTRQHAPSSAGRPRRTRKPAGPVTSSD